MMVTVLREGVKLRWSCDSCTASGVSWIAMTGHMLTSGHEWFQVDSNGLHMS